MFFPLNGIIMLCIVCNKTFKMFTQIIQFRANLKRAATLLENDDGENYKWCDYPMCGRSYGLFPLFQTRCMIALDIRINHINRKRFIFYIKRNCYN